MKDKVFDRLYTKFVDDCIGWLHTNASLGRGAEYDHWYKNRMHKLCLEYKEESLYAKKGVCCGQR